MKNPKIGGQFGKKAIGSAGFIVKLPDGTCIKCVDGEVADFWIEGEIPSDSRYNSGASCGHTSKAANGFGILMSGRERASRGKAG